MRMPGTVSLVIAGFILFAGPVAASDRLELRDGDRVVFVGGALVEREQEHGYWEALLTSRRRDLNLTFRNLGWSGDTVWGEARAEFGTIEDGYQALLSQVNACQPTVIFLAYGSNESFAGEAGLSDFEKAYERLLDDLAPLKARICVVLPPRAHNAYLSSERLADRNRELERYSAVMRSLAMERNLPIVDLFNTLSSPVMFGGKSPMIALGYEDDGQLDAWGYLATAWPFVEVASRGDSKTTDRVVRQPGDRIEVFGTRVSRAERGDSRIAWTAPAATLPAVPAEGTRRPVNFDSANDVVVGGLAPGKYELRIDGQPVIRATHHQWAAGIDLRRAAPIDEFEALRQAIIKKNELYFHRWRPANTTYLFGFRKHEQGNNASEIPEFDPLVAESERLIAELRHPKTHRYELIRIEDEVQP